jgi:Fur family ferric uptake transcriptional regulator
MRMSLKIDLRVRADPADGFRSFLRAGGHSFTSQRHSVLQEVLRSAAHFDAEELYARLRKRRAGASRATLYRTLGHLERWGLIRRVELDEDHAHYELTEGIGHHEHLVCERCGRVAEFTDPELEARIEEVIRARGFAASRHTVLIVGACAECRGRGAG